MASCSLEAHLHVPGEPVTKNKTNTKKVSKKIDRYITLDTLYFVFSCLHTCFLVQALKAPLMILAPCIRYGAGCLFALCKPTEQRMQILSPSESWPLNCEQLGLLQLKRAQRTV